MILLEKLEWQYRIQEKNFIDNCEYNYNEKKLKQKLHKRNRNTNVDVEIETPESCELQSP